MPLDATKLIKASDLIANADEIRALTQPCIMISDYSMPMTFNNFIAAINLLIEDGWRIDPPMTNGGYLIALCHNPRYKRKTPASEGQEEKSWLDTLVSQLLPPKS